MIGNPGNSQKENIQNSLVHHRGVSSPNYHGLKATKEDAPSKKEGGIGNNPVSRLEVFLTVGKLINSFPKMSGVS